MCRNVLNHAKCVSNMLNYASNVLNHAMFYCLCWQQAKTYQQCAHARNVIASQIKLGTC